MACHLIFTAGELYALAATGELSPAVYLSALQATLQSELGREYYRTGLAIEPIASQVVQTAIQSNSDRTFDKGVHGLDARQVAGDTRIAIEVKTTWDSSKPFERYLDTPNSGQQMSDAWLRANGEDPANTVCLGILVDRNTETASVFLRLDEDAREWTPVLEQVPVPL